MMREQGCLTLSPDASGRILDRWAGLEKIISPEMVRQVWEDTQRVNSRACPLTHEVMMWVVLAMGVLTDLPIRQVFRHARRRRRDEVTPGRSSLCEARQRWGVEPLRELPARIARPLATPDTPGAFSRGDRWMGIDGSVFDVPDSEAHAVFGRASGGRGDGAFPQIRQVRLVEVGTHVETALALGGWPDSEQALVPQRWDDLPFDTRLLEDRGLFRDAHWIALPFRGKLLIRGKKNFVLPPIRDLSDGSYLAKIYPAPDDRDKDRHGVVVRVMDDTLNDPQRTDPGEVHRLITNLLDETQFPARELILLSHERWEVELVFDEQKTHQDPRRAEKPAPLRSETPEGVRQEMSALSLGHFVVRAPMFEAARPAQWDVDRLSFTGGWQILQCRLPECDSRTGKTLTTWYEALLSEMCQEQIGPRRNRINPRVIKRKMSQWNKKRPHHRRLKPLLKRFEDCIVMAN